MNQETELQINCFQWAWNKYPEYRRQLFHVPNGGKRSPFEASIMKQSGVVPGIPDLIFVKNTETHFFELKTDKGVLSDKQIKIHAQFKQNGYPVYLITTLNQFQIIFNYILQKKDTMKQDDFEYQIKVWRGLFQAKAISDIDIFKIKDKLHREKFVNCVNKFIDNGMDKANGFELCFVANIIQKRPFFWGNKDVVNGKKES